MCPLVFPACAGMFRLGHTFVQFLHGFPRVRGDVPLENIEPDTKSEFSPRARGCSYHCLQCCENRQVFPACAGMFPPVRTSGELHGSFPRVRGDVPVPHRVRVRAARFSPRARGCSATCSPSKARQVVFPACAGMFPQGCIKHDNTTSFPRVRGDVPTSV